MKIAQKRKENGTRNAVDKSKIKKNTSNSLFFPIKFARFGAVNRLMQKCKTGTRPKIVLYD